MSKTPEDVTDLLAGTVVIQERMAAPEPDRVELPAQLRSWATGADVGRLPVPLVQDIRSFLPRADRIHPDSRRQLARDLLRVRTDLLAIPPGTPMARRRGIIEAYDELLAEACHELGLDDSLGDLTRVPLECRQLERTQVEQALDRAGLRLAA